MNSYCTSLDNTLKLILRITFAIKTNYGRQEVLLTTVNQFIFADTLFRDLLLLVHFAAV